MNEDLVAELLETLGPDGFYALVEAHAGVRLYVPADPDRSDLSDVRRQGFWDNRRFDLTEALAHQGCHFRLPLLDEASGAV